MRKKIKITFLLLLSFTGLVFVSCELQEETIHQHEYNSNLKLYEMKFEELMTNNKFVNSFSKLPKSKISVTTASLGKTVMEKEYGFTIANKPAKVFENNGETSYTFLITRDSTNSDSFENLVIQTDSSNTTKAVIIKYNLTSPITRAEDNSYSFDAEKKITPIVYNNSPIIESKMVIECQWITTVYCNNDGSGGIGAEHIAGPNCSQSHMYSDSEYICTTSDDGTFDSSSGGVGTSGGGSSGGNNSTYDGSDPNIHGNGSNSINTATVIPEIEEIIEDPCESLKNLSKPDKYNINPIVDSLKQKVINRVKKEWGTEFIRESYYDAVADENVVNYSTNLRVGLNYDIFLASGEEYNVLNHVIKYLGGIHLHPLDGYSMFSWGDLKSLMGMYENSSNSYKPEISLLLVCYNHVDPSKPHVYAIRVENIDALRRKINEQWNHADYSGITDKKKKMDLINDKSSKQYEANKNDLERFFLQKYNDFGISFYKAEDDMSNWNKKSLGSGAGSTQIIVDTPCNL